jgi:hypothetical protein
VSGLQKLMKNYRRKIGGNFFWYNKDGLLQFRIMSGAKNSLQKPSFV